jgi:hypothetical protein
MPYIKDADRWKLDSQVEGGLWPSADTPGELNYIFTVIALDYFEYHGGNYQAINDILGALEGAKLEFYRRKAADYEDTKIKENGDVY